MIAHICQILHRKHCLSCFMVDYQHYIYVIYLVNGSTILHSLYLHVLAHAPEVEDIKAECSMSVYHNSILESIILTSAIYSTPRRSK